MEMDSSSRAIRRHLSPPSLHLPGSRPFPLLFPGSSARWNIPSPHRSWRMGQPVRRRPSVASGGSFQSTTTASSKRQLL